jgi:hypothetical protein
MFHVYFTNFRYSVHGFNTMAEAVDYMKDKGLMASVFDGEYNLMVSYDPLSGVTWQSSLISV